jgi:hypothetical protein
MSGRNANVFYEVGYAHALGKIVLLLTKNADDIPFDLKHYPHIVYGSSITQLRKDLSNRLVWAVAESKRLSEEENKASIALSMNDIEIPELYIGIGIPHLLFNISEKIYILLRELNNIYIPHIRHLYRTYKNRGFAIYTSPDNVDTSHFLNILKDKIMPLLESKGYKFEGNYKDIINNGFVLYVKFIIQNLGSDIFANMKIYIITDFLINNRDYFREFDFPPNSLKIF